VIDTTTDLRRVVHQWQKHANNPALRPNKPWKYAANYLNADESVIYDESEQIFKTCYWTMNAEDSKVPICNVTMTCYAKSPDGIRWVTPNIVIYRFQDTTESNIVLTTKFEDRKSNPTLFTFGAIRTPWDPDPA